MRRLDNRVFNVAADEILAFACLRDEAVRIPWFLEYHRRLGVDRFFVVDNGSSDGSTEFLMSQPDVVVYYTNDSYAASECGLRWTNELLARFAGERWALTLDADELLSYPGCEKLGLRSFTRYLESVGADALRAMLLDMYSDHAVRETSYSPGQPFLDACPFFDADSYTFSPADGVAARGGSRERVFWRGRDRGYPAPFLLKVPLVKWKPGRVYEASTHKISDITASAVTGALLHFKFFGDFGGRVALEAERKEHFAGARQYAAYAEVMEQDRDLTLFHDRSVRYRDSVQLVRLGLSRAPEEYLRLLE